MKHYILFACLVLSGCSAGKIIENISEYDYKYSLGYNAAINQFGDNSMLFINLENKRVIKYTGDEPNTGYADGYHEALRIMKQKTMESNMSCPYIGAK